MNSSIYIFGELSYGYSQYPEDSSSNLFKNIQDQCVAPSQLIIHRDDNMMYYIYVRKFNAKKYIGIALAINGCYFTQIQPLFSLFEKEIEELVETGVIINLTDDGEITSYLTSLKEQEEEVLSVINILQTKVNKLRALRQLPPVDFTVAITSRKLFKETDSPSDIVDASYRFGFTTVLKEEDYDTVRTKSFRNILKNLNADKNLLIKEIDELKERNRKIQRQKKQFRNVILLILVVIFCGVGLYFLNQNLNDTRYRLDTANNTISEKDAIIDGNNSTMSDLRDSIASLENNLRQEIEAKENAEKTIKRICSYSPIAVTGCSVNSTHFTLNYYSPVMKQITVTLKALNENDGEIITSTHTFTTAKGNGTKRLDFNKEIDGDQSYYVVLNYEGHIIAGKRW